MKHYSKIVFVLKKYAFSNIGLIFLYSFLSGKIEISDFEDCGGLFGADNITQSRQCKHFQK